MAKLQALQAMRAVAVLGVVVHHVMSLSDIHHEVAVGAAGVDIFFVLSGIVMVVSTREGMSPTDFAWRRLIRVVPLYWIATAAVLPYLFWRYGQTPSSEHIISSLLFLPPPEHLVYPLLYPGWSLNYEMFFYGLLAFSLFWGLRGFIFVAILTASLAAAGSRTGVFPINYYLNPHLLEFSGGLLIGWAVRHRHLPIDNRAGAILLAASVVLFAWNSGPPGANVAVLWGGPAAFMVLGVMAFEQARLVRSRAVQIVGDASYSIYLFHPFVIWGADWIFGGSLPLPAVIAVLTASILGGIAIHFCLEMPLLHGAKRISSARATA